MKKFEILSIMNLAAGIQGDYQLDYFEYLYVIEFKYKDYEIEISFTEVDNDLIDTWVKVYQDSKSILFDKFNSVDELKGMLKVALK